MLYDSSSASSPPIRCRLLSKTALKDSRSARSCSWNILVLLDPPVFPLEVEFSSSRNGFDFCASVSEKQTKTDYLSWTFSGNNKRRLNLSTDENGYTRNPKYVWFRKILRKEKNVKRTIIFSYLVLSCKIPKKKKKSIIIIIH